MSLIDNKYTQLLKKLLPIGKAWSRDAGAMPSLLNAISEELVRTDTQIGSLVLERNSKTTNLLIPEHENDFGITPLLDADVYSYSLTSQDMGTRIYSAFYLNGFIYGTDFTNAKLLKLDSANLEVVDSLTVGALPFLISYLSGYLWVTSSTSKTVAKINVSNFSIEATFTVGTFPREAVAGGGYIWVANSGVNTINKINPTTGSNLTITLSGGVHTPDNIIYYDDHVWVLSRNSPGKVEKIIVSTGASAGVYDYGVVVGGVVVYNDHIYIYRISSVTVSHIIKVDPSDGSIVDSVELLNTNSFARAAYGGFLQVIDDELWVLNSTVLTGVKIEVIDLNTMTKTNTIDVGASDTTVDYSRCMEYLLGQVWVYINSVSKLVQIDPSSKELVETFEDVSNDCRLMSGGGDDVVLIPGIDDVYQITRQAQTASLEERRNAVIAATVAVGGQDPQYFIDLAAGMGYTITITEFRPAWCGIAVAGDPCGDQHVIFVWRVNLLYDRDYIDSTGADLYAKLLVLKPAHTELIFEIVGPGFSRGFSAGFDAMPALTVGDRLPGGFRYGGFTRGFDLNYSGGFRYGAFTSGFNNLK